MEGYDSVSIFESSTAMEHQEGNTDSRQLQQWSIKGVIEIKTSMLIGDQGDYSISRGVMVLSDG